MLLPRIHKEPFGKIEFLNIHVRVACQPVNRVLVWCSTLLRGLLRALLIVALYLVSLNALISLTALAQSLEEKSRSIHGGATGPKVVFDAYHSHTWIDTLPAPGLNQYHLLSNLTRAWKSLEAQGWESRLQLTAWDSQSLESADLVVLNLPSADLPPFLVPEVVALREYVMQGGGLIMILDHTNCYFHQHVFGSLFAELDIALWNETACDRVPHKLASGNAWLRIRGFSEHPIVNGLREIGVQTSGVTDSRYGIAWTGAQGWGDIGRVPKYGEGQDVGFFGDFQQQPHERTGPLPVVAAKEFGKGRIVVIADQNLVGSMFLPYADNRKLWIQATAWASGREPIERIGVDKWYEGERTVVWCYEPLAMNKAYWGSTDPERFYHAYGLLSKHTEPHVTDRAVPDSRWLFIPDDSLFDNPEVKRLAQQFILSAERQLVVFSTSNEDGESPKRSEAVPPWLNLLVGEPTYPLDIAPGFEGAGVRSWKLANGSKIHVASKLQWDNRAIASPYKTRNEDQEREDLARLECFWKNGMYRVESIDQEFHIPVE